MELHKALKCNPKSTGKHYLSEHREEIGGHDCVNFDMHLKPEFKRNWRWNLMLWSSKLGDAPEGQD